MIKKNLVRPIVLVALALASSTSAQDKSPAEDGINLCVEMRERIYECKEEFAEAFVAHHNPKPEERQAIKKKALEEITADGSGPLEPRRQVCADMAKRGMVPPADRVRELKRALGDCVAKSDCPGRVACLMPIIREQVGKGKSAKR